MRITRITVLAAFLFFYSGCKKADVTQSTTGTDDPCTVQKAVNDGAVIPGQYIIAYRNSGEVAAASTQQMTRISKDVLEAHHITASSIRHSFNGSVRGFVASLSEDQARELRKETSIQAVEQDRIVALSTCFTVVAPTLITWNVNKTGYGDGTGKTAWIVDTGLDFDHPDLTVDAARSKSFIPDVTSPEDENGHGTHVGGIIGAKNNNIGTLGVASGATLVSLRVLDKDGKGTLSSIIQALSYVSVNGRAGDVVNMSLGEDEPSDILDQAVQAVAAKGLYVTIAAGNETKAADLYSPGRANAPNIYTVSAVDSLDNFASFSNFGNDVVDYAAPGVHILSTYKDGLYAKMSGTSMAAPHVAGLLLINKGVVHSVTTAKNDPDGTPDPIAVK